MNHVVVTIHGRLMNFTDSPGITPPPLPSLAASLYIFVFPLPLFADTHPFAASECSKGGGVPGPVVDSSTAHTHPSEEQANEIENLKAALAKAQNELREAEMTKTSQPQNLRM
jgi:hypothetical protein